MVSLNTKDVTMRLQEQMRQAVESRYIFSPKIGDNALPWSLIEPDMRIHNGDVISENAKNFIDYTGKTLGFDHLKESVDNKFEITTDIKQRLIDKMEDRKIVVIGYGGFMANMFYFLHKLLNDDAYNSSTQIAYRMYIYEPEGGKPLIPIYKKREWGQHRWVVMNLNL